MFGYIHCMYTVIRRLNQVQLRYILLNYYTYQSPYSYLYTCIVIIINPGLVPQPEPYFDLTPIRVTHTKIFLPKDLNLII